MLEGAEIEMDVPGEIFPREFLVEAMFGGVAVDDGIEVRDTLLICLSEDFNQRFASII